MRCVSRFLLCVIAGVFVCLPDSGNTDIGPIQSRGGSATPTSAHETIRMDYMEVTIRLRKTAYTIDALFHLFNTGGPTTEWVGFPKYGTSTRSRSYGFVRFDAWVDGRKTAFKEELDLFRRAGPYSTRRFVREEDAARWMVHKVRFPGHSVTRIRIRYETRYGKYGTVQYYFGTGRYWKGNIEKAALTIDSTDVGGMKYADKNYVPVAASPGPRVISKNVVRYELGDFEPSPTDRFSLRFRKGQFRSKWKR